MPEILPTLPGLPPAWHIFVGNNRTDPAAIDRLPAAPPWRAITGNATKERGSKHQFAENSAELDCVNAALILRRPLLITGKPGTGKSSLAYAIAHELNLGQVLVWNITSRTSLQDGLYRYDAIGRLQETSRRERAAAVSPEDGPAIGDFIQLGPLGTAFLPSTQAPPRPRVLLIDEIDKSDIDLPNDLLNILEECSFEIPEIARLSQEEKPRRGQVRTADAKKTKIPEDGRVMANVFPIIVMTSNDERQFPAAFLRRCIALTVTPPDKATLERIVNERVQAGAASNPAVQKLIDDFLREREAGTLTGATDHLLNAAFLVLRGVPLEAAAGPPSLLRQTVLQSTSSAARP